ncbi:MAG: response regulator [Paenibacillaceae bacterium]|nr:response regulator [Paenibacillaceae bacterium]
MSSGRRISLPRRFVAMMLLFIVAIIVAAAVLIAFNQFRQQQYITDTDDIKAKQVQIKQIDATLNQIFFRARGYFAFKSKDEYDQIFAAKAELEKALQSFRQTKMSEDERKLVDTVEQFKNDYFATTLPNYVKTMEASGTLSTSTNVTGTFTQSLNDMLKYTATFSSQNDLKLQQQLDELRRQLANNDYWFVAYIMMVMLLVTAVIAVAARNIGRPLEQLTGQAERITQGETVKVTVIDSNNEIGSLTRAFDTMLKKLHAKEEELTVQNEELLAQQDELQSQQDELQQTMRKMELNELLLQRRNALIQAMTNTLDKQKLLNSIISHLVEIGGADKGMIVLLGDNKQYASYGVSGKGAAQLLEQLEHDVLHRLEESKRTFTIARPAYLYERGYHAHDREQAYDLFQPVLSTGGDVIAVLAMTRIGNPLTEQEMNDAESTAQQIALALEKLGMYEETERQRQLTQDIMNTINTGVQMVGSDGLMHHVNETLCDLIGCDSVDTLLGAEIGMFFRMLESNVQHHDRLVKFMIDSMDDRSLRQQYVYEIAGRDRRIVQLFAEPLTRDGDRMGTVFVHRDITREYEVDQMKSEFVSTVSHELRTPLSSVLGFAELLLNRELKPERQRKYVATIHQEATRLTKLINDFLDVQRMEAGKQTYDWQQLELAPLIAETIELHREHAASLGCSIGFAVEGDDSGHVYGDADKIRQVLTNLFSNAIKYSPKGGDIEISLKRAGDYWIVGVTDHGLGIPAEAIPRLFTKFYRIDNSDRREIGGTGLGLSIVKEIMKAHSGDVTVSSTFGSGSRFELHFPVVLADSRSEAAAGAAPHEVQGHGRKTVVLIEDDSSLTELLSQELRDNGFRVLPFSKGQEALQAIKSVIPDAVVVDIMLHHSMDGWSIMKELKKDPRLAHIPIFVSTALEEKETGLTLGAEVYLIKPYPPRELSRVIHESLERESKPKE